MPDAAPNDTASQTLSANRKPSIAAYTLKARLLGDVDIIDPEGETIYTLAPQHGKLTERMFKVKDAEQQNVLEIRQQHTIFYLNYELSLEGKKLGFIRTKGVIDHYIFQLEGMPEHDIKTGLGFTTQYVLKSKGAIVSLIKVGIDKWTVRLGKNPHSDALLWCLALSYKNSLSKL